MNENAQEHEIMSLNIDDLDIEELERRLELAVLTPSTEPVDCGTNCPPPCPNLVCCSNGRG